MNASMILSFERDINDPLITFCPATLLARGDRNANIIKLTVMDGNAPADLSGNTAVVLFQRPGDSYVVRCPGSVSGNVISATLLGDCYIYAGQYYASLILDADGITRTMLRLSGQIESNGDGPVIDPTGTIPGYEDIARIYAELEASLGRSDAATDSANAAAQNANEKAALANEAAGNANVAAGNANGATARANEASESIEGLTVEASDVAYNKPATATVTDVEGHKHIAFGLRQGVPGAVPNITFTGETGEPNTDVVIMQSGPPEAPVVNLKIPQGVPGTGNVSTVDGVGSDAGGNVALSAVRYVAQTLEDAQKVQVRENIGVDGQVYPCTATALEEMSTSDLVGIYNQGYRAVQATNNETVVTLGLAADGSLAWQGCNQGRTNLLDNPDFSNPINQRGLTTYSGSFIYSIDRWVISGTISLQSGGIAVSPNGFFLQRMEPLINGEDYTLAVYVGNQLLVGTVTYDSVSSDTQIAVSNSLGTLYIQNIEGNLCQFVVNTVAQSIISMPVLLKGAYTAKTLPPWEAPDAATKYLKCRRYCRNFDVTNKQLIGICFYPNAVAVLGGVFDIPMRSTPTCSASGITSIDNSVKYDITSYIVGSDGLVWIAISNDTPISVGTYVYVWDLRLSSDL